MPQVRPASRQSLSLTYHEHDEDFTLAVKNQRLQKKHFVAVRDIDKAERADQQLMNLRDQEKLAKREFEQQRQQRERRLFHKATAALERTLETTLQQKHEEHERQIQSRVDRLDEVHQVERRRLQNEIATKRCPATKYSSEVLDMLKMENRMLKGGYYEDARLLRRHLAELKQLEEARHKQTFKAALSKPLVRLEEKQQRERNELREKITALRHNEQFAHTNARRNKKQTHKGMEHEMNHCHKMEWVKKKELPVSIVHSWPNRFGTSFTFAGSILNARLFGGDVELPSLCNLVDLDELYNSKCTTTRSSPSRLGREPLRQLSQTQ